MSEVIQDQAQYRDIKEKCRKAKQNLADMKLDISTGASESECNDVKQRFKEHKFRFLSLKITDTKKTPPEPIVKRKKFFDKSEGGSPSQILADFANAENLTEDKLPSPYILAQLLMDEECFLIVGGALYVFTGIVYEVLDDAAFDRLIMKKLRKYIEVGGRPEILRAIRTFVKAEPELVIDDPTIDPNYIVFRNGRINLYTGEFEENDPSIFQTSYLNFDFDKDAKYSPAYDAYLDKVSDGNPDVKELMLQAHGYVASGSMEGKVFFVFYGPGNTGKSLTINLYSLMFSNEFISTVELQALGDRFSSGNLVHKRLNIGGDLPNKPLTPDVVKLVKGITGNDLMTAEKKFVQPFSFKPTSKLVFATNHPLILQQNDDQFRERLVVVPFLNRIPKEEQDHDLLNKLKEELPAIFNKIFKAYLRLRDNNFIFPTPADVSEYLAVPSATRENASHLDEAVCGFVAQCCEITGDKEDFISAQQLYTEFNAYYQSNFNLTVEQDKFSKAFKTLFDRTDSDGYPQRKQKNKGRGYIGIRFKA